MQELEEAGEQAQREGMSCEIMGGGTQLLGRTSDAALGQQGCARLVRQAPKINHRRSAGFPSGQIANSSSAGQHDETVTRRRLPDRQSAQKRAQSLILQSALLTLGAILQRLQAIEHQQYAAVRHLCGQPLALGARARGIELDLELAPSKCLDIRKSCAILSVAGLRERGIGENVIVLRYFP